MNVQSSCLKPILIAVTAILAVAAVLGAVALGINFQDIAQQSAAFYSTIAATVVGGLLGIFLTYWLSRTSKKEEPQQNNETGATNTVKAVDFAPPKKVTLPVRDNTGPFTIEIEDNKTVKDLKLLVAQRQKLAEGQIRLKILSENSSDEAMAALEDGQLIRDIHLGDGQFISAAIRII